MTASAFGQNSMVFVARRRELANYLFSSTGDSLPPHEDGGFGDFLNPKHESEQLRRARAYMSEQSLPLSYSSRDEEGGNSGDDDAVPSDGLIVKKDSSTPVDLGNLTSRGGVLGGLSQDSLAKNPYMQVVSRLSPSELISKFTATANPRVQDAARNTVLGLMGSLPKMAFETKTITTGERLASLMFQLQMTGYMFKSADYRLSLSQCLGAGMKSYQDRLPGSDSDAGAYPVNGKVTGKLKLKFGRDTLGSTSDTDKEYQNSTSLVEIEIDAAAYMSELRSEVQQLRDELTRMQQSKEDALRKDLLLYIRTLPEQELRSLTNTISQEVLSSMKGLVNIVMSGIGNGQITSDTVMEQRGEAMAQLCMWQLVVGYNLRELEVREEMNNLCKGFPTGTDGGVDLSQRGTLE